jgi:hypothetical protein
VWFTWRCRGVFLRCPGVVVSLSWGFRGDDVGVGVALSWSFRGCIVAVSWDYRGGFFAFPCRFVVVL